MKKFLYLVLLFVMPLSAYDFKITVRWDEMADMGEADGILQYYHTGKVEAIRGNLQKPSSDGNILVNRTFNGDTQEFIIIDSKDCIANIWIANPLIDEDFSTAEDLLMLSRSDASVRVEDNVNHKTYEVKVPENQPGLVFHGGAIIDGQFIKITEMYETQRLYKVSMVHAVTGKILSGVNVIVKNKTTNETVCSGQTDKNGVFSHKFDYGQYEVTFTKEGFISSRHTFEMDLTELPVSMNFALTPKIDKIRIVLTWGAHPEDLDAHLSGPSGSNEQFHIWWRNRTLIDGRDFLDVDDQHSYGPETVTIYKPMHGTYRYVVHNFSGRHRKNSFDLSYSHAHVDVYADGALKAGFDIPCQSRGNVWNVFEINEYQRIIPVNQLYDERESSDVIH